ncbi:hypothetical protein ACI65C_012232 [Semiaphis heraclei]
MVGVCWGWRVKDWFYFLFIDGNPRQRVKRGQRVLVSDRILCIVVPAGVGPSRRAQTPHSLAQMTTRVNENTDDPTARSDLLYCCYIVRGSNRERDYEGRPNTSGVISAARWSRSGKMAVRIRRTSVARYLNITYN